MTPLRPVPIDLRDLRSVFCFGVAGNFAGHLEQAGEAVDFANVTAAAQMPKGIFPWYVPGSDARLGTFPISSDELAVPLPPRDAPHRIQVEPELGLLCDIVRDDSGEVQTLAPRWIAAFDDCSLRRPGARKISDKKNWGAASKGIAARGFEVADLDRDGALASMRLACFLRRGEQTHAYGVDSAVPSYTLFGRPLIDWLVDRLRHQREAKDSPLEDVGAMLHSSPASRAFVGIGATRYEPYGETTFIEPGDEAIVVLYDSTAHAASEVREAVADQCDDQLAAASVVRRVARLTPSARPPSPPGDPPHAPG